MELILHIIETSLRNIDMPICDCQSSLSDAQQSEFHLYIDAKDMLH